MPDDLLAYLDQKVDNRSALIESLLQQWRQQQEDKALAEACRLVDELDLGWDEEWQSGVPWVVRVALPGDTARAIMD